MTLRLESQLYNLMLFMLKRNKQGERTSPAEFKGHFKAIWKQECLIETTLGKFDHFCIVKTPSFDLQNDYVLESTSRMEEVKNLTNITCFRVIRNKQPSQSLSNSKKSILGIFFIKLKELTSLADLVQNLEEINGLKDIYLSVGIYNLIVLFQSEEIAILTNIMRNIRKEAKNFEFESSSLLCFPDEEDQLSDPTLFHILMKPSKNDFPIDEIDAVIKRHTNLLSFSTFKHISENPEGKYRITERQGELPIVIEVVAQNLKTILDLILDLECIEGIEDTVTDARLAIS